MASKIKSTDPQSKRTILILSKTIIWPRIIKKQFFTFVFSNSERFTQFTSLIEYIKENLNDENIGDFALAIGARDISWFLISWEDLRKAGIGQKMKSILDALVVFYVVDSEKNVKGEFKEQFGVDRMIYLRDNPDVNREKVKRAMGLWGQKSD